MTRSEKNGSRSIFQADVRDGRKRSCREVAELRFIQPGRSSQNACIERCNRTCRDEVLGCYDYDMLDEVRRMTADWLVRHNERQPHESLGNLSPRQCLMAGCA